MVYSVGRYDSTYKRFNNSNNLLTSLCTPSFNRNSMSTSYLCNNCKNPSVNLVNESLKYDVFDKFDRQTESYSLKNAGVPSKKYSAPVKREFT